MAAFYAIYLDEMKKIKILFTIPNFDTAGSGKALLNIAKGLDKNRFEAEIMCLHSRGAFFKEVQASGLNVHVYPYLSPARPYLQLLKNVYRVAQKFKAINPDVIHSFHYAADYTEAMAARLAGKKWVFTKKNMNWGGASKNAWHLRSFLAHRIAIQNTDMKKQFYAKNHKTRLIPRGVNTQFFNAPKSATPSDSMQDKPATDRRFLICVANFVPVKGIEYLLQAFNSLAHQYPQWHLLLVGDDSNDYGKFLKDMVQSLTLEDRVKFTGKVLDVRQFLNRAEIFILPTKDKGRREGSPVALLEAMASGKVVLASDIPGVRDQLKSFPQHLVQPENAKDLANKLEALMTQSSQALNSLGQEFARYVQEQHNIEQEIERHQNLYLEICSL